MKLRFTTDGIVNGKVEFEAGKVYEISNELGSADRWIKRGAQVVKEGEEQSVTPPAEEVIDNSGSQSASDLFDSVDEQLENSTETPASEENVVKEEEKKENKKGKQPKAK